MRRERPLTIVVGTGRCGSTMLSDLFAVHGDVLSLSEFFACLSPLAFPDGPVSGTEFWRILAEPRLKPNVLIRHGAAPDEFRYLEQDRRFTGKAVPAISLVTLPALVSDPDALYDELEKTVPGWAAAPVRVHYRCLFEWLADRLARDIVIERSGGSLRFLPRLAECFPDAKFVHVYRQGADCALSMSRHPSFRLTAAIEMLRPYIGVDPFHQPSAAHRARLPAALHSFLPDEFDTGALWQADITLGTFGALWSSQLLAAVRHLAALPPQRLLHVEYESVLADPVTELERVGSFAGIPAPRRWSRQVASRVDSSRAHRAAALDPAQREELDRACRIGSRVLLSLNGANAKRAG